MKTSETTNTKIKFTYICANSFFYNVMIAAFQNRKFMKKYYAEN